MKEIAIVGDLSAPATQALAGEVVRARYLPNAQLAIAEPTGEAAELVPLLRGRSLVEGEPAAYVCERFTCLLPVTTPEALAAQL